MIDMILTSNIDDPIFDEKAIKYRKKTVTISSLKKAQQNKARLAFSRQRSVITATMVTSSTFFSQIKNPRVYTTIGLQKKKRRSGRARRIIQSQNNKPDEAINTSIGPLWPPTCWLNSLSSLSLHCRGCTQLALFFDEKETNADFYFFLGNTYHNKLVWINLARERIETCLGTMRLCNLRNCKIYNASAVSSRKTIFIRADVFMCWSSFMEPSGVKRLGPFCTYY